MFLWSYGLMVMTEDFESSNLGSIPSKTYFLICIIKILIKFARVFLFDYFLNLFHQ